MKLTHEIDENLLSEKLLLDYMHSVFEDVWKAMAIEQIGFKRCLKTKNVSLENTNFAYNVLHYRFSNFIFHRSFSGDR